MDLTGRQQEIWSFLVDYVDRHGYPPTVREIGEAVGLASPSTVHAHLANLERAGLLRRDTLLQPVVARQQKIVDLLPSLDLVHSTNGSATVQPRCFRPARSSTSSSRSPSSR